MLIYEDKHNEEIVQNIKEDMRHLNCIKKEGTSCLRTKPILILPHRRLIVKSWLCVLIPLKKTWRFNETHERWHMLVFMHNAWENVCGRKEEIKSWGPKKWQPHVAEHDTFNETERVRMKSALLSITSIGNSTILFSKWIHGNAEVWVSVVVGLVRRKIKQFSVLR